MIIKEQEVCQNKSWIDVTDPTIREMKELSDKYGLNEHAVRDCLEPEHLPKYEFIDDVHFLILRFYAHGSEKKITTIQDLTNKIAIFFTEDILITIHKNPVSFLDVIRKSYVETKKCSSVTQVITRIFLLGLEMILGLELFKSEKDMRAATVVPIAFPLIAGSGTLTTIISLKANYAPSVILFGILTNLIFIFIVLKSLRLIERALGPAGLIAVRKFFGVILLAIAVKIFATNAPGLIK